jgi:fructose-1,6-bisphosphatase/inositol monophosphatase family enzyme
MDPLQCAIETARAAGDVLLERVGMPLEAAEKGLRGDLVTASDRASEALIVARLRAAFPDAAIPRARATNDGSSIRSTARRITRTTIRSIASPSPTNAGVNS